MEWGLHWGREAQRTCTRVVYSACMPRGMAEIRFCERVARLIPSRRRNRVNRVFMPVYQTRGGPTDAPKREQTTQNLKSARTACYAARDAYYECLDSCKDTSLREADAATQSDRCAHLREAYTGACQASWVTHFDRLREKENRVYQRIQASIQASGKREGTLGGLQGENKRPAS